jgi:hypothetical protein
MDDIQALRTTIQKHREKNGKRMAFPKKVWDQIINLADDMPSSILAKELGISHGNLARQLRKRESNAADDCSFVEVPQEVVAKKQMTLELPHNIVVRIDL